MPEIDYSKTIIYKITCKDANIPYIYVNNTVDLPKMKYHHKRQLANGNKHELYQNIREHGGIDNWNIEIIESYPECKTINDATARVNKWMKEFSIEKREPAHIKKPMSMPICNKCKSKIVCQLFECKKCGKKFTRDYNLTRHIKHRCKEANDQSIYELKEENAKLKKELEELRDKMKRLNEIIHFSK